MKSTVPLQGVFFSFLLLFCTRAQAQVFIPDTAFRNAMNAWIPGVVDNFGVMDTLHPGIPTTDSVEFIIHSSEQSLDLEAVRHLDSLRYLRIVVDSVGLDLPVIPPQVQVLAIWSAHGSIDLGVLPNDMHTIQVNFTEQTEGTSLHVTHMPDHVDELSVHGAYEVTWPGTVHADQVTWGGLALTGPFALPDLETGTLHLSSMNTGAADLQNVTADRLSLDAYCGIQGPITWPNGINGLDYSNPYITGLAFENWPPAMDTLYFLDINPKCMPVLPEQLKFLTVYLYYQCIPNWPDSLDEMLTTWDWATDTENTALYCSVLNSDCPGANPGISGQALLDVNANGLCDTGEPPLPQAMVTLLPNGNVTGCDENGYWEIGVQPGNYAITPSSSYPYIQSISPAEHTANLPNLGEADTQNDFAVILIPDIEDLRAQFYAEPARPGFDNRLHLTCQNYGTVPMDAQLTLEYDSDQTWIGSSIVPSTQSGTTVSWSLPGMAIGASQTITVDLNTGASVPLGMPITYTLSAHPTSDDETPSDNLVVYNDSVVGSFDPNDKSVSPSVMSPTEVQVGTAPINYIIRFQNTGTYLAERVLILDTLPSGLQVESLQFLGSSHACDWYVTEGVLHVLHQDINLPDSTSDEANSHGFIRFSILPETDLLDGAEIVNIAHIVFDFNEPIVTPPATFRVDVTAAVEETAEAGVRVHPNPVRDHLWITLPQNDRAPISYVVQDLFGRNVLSGSIRSDVAMDVSGLPSGVFVLTAKGAASTFSARFVKQ